MFFLNNILNFLVALFLFVLKQFFLLKKYFFIALIFFIFSSYLELYYYNLEYKIIFLDMEDNIIILKKHGVYVRCDYTLYKDSIVCFTGNEHIKMFP
jgi:hypothetical protein